MSSFRRRLMMAQGGGGGRTPENAEEGIYIYSTDGFLYTKDEWDTSNNSKAVGVAVISDNCRFVIEKNNNDQKMGWGRSDTDIPDLNNMTDSSQAKLDYNGKSNTDKIIAELGSDTNYAAGWCRSKSITVNGNTKYGYLPSLGECQTAYNNKDQVDSALTKIGGTAIVKDWYWSSTEGSSINAWHLDWSNGSVAKRNKSFGSHYCRAWFEL